METVSEPIIDPALLKMRANALANFDVRSKRGIEIGPLYRPLVEKTSSEIYYVDHCTTEEYAAYREKRRTPGLRTIMDSFANIVKADCYALWADYQSKDDLPFVFGPEFLSVAAQHHAEGRYIDVHCWVFTPWSFLALLHRITADTGLGFDLEYFDTTHQNDLEFYVRLVRTPEPKTDWLHEAAKAESTALWPQNR